MSDTRLPLQYPCLHHEHEWQYREIDGETWNVCWDCGFRELWADGMLIDSSNYGESYRLDKLEGAST